MKILFNIFILLLILSAKLESDVPETNKEISFSKFIDLLEKNEYRESFGLPKFNHENIDSLLIMAEKNKVIYNFPRNPLSSYYIYSCPLRAVCLWLIEGIRLYDTTLGIDFKYPSLNPVIHKYGDEVYENNAEVLDKALKLYKKWWNKDDYENIRYKDPLLNSGLSWL